MAMVHTRTIVDPTFGFKLSGKMGATNTFAAIYARDYQPGRRADEHPDFSIFRLKHALKDDSYHRRLLHRPRRRGRLQPRRRRGRPVPAEPDRRSLVPSVRLVLQESGGRRDDDRPRPGPRIHPSTTGRSPWTSATRTSPRTSGSTRASSSGRACGAWPLSACTRSIPSRSSSRGSSPSTGATTSWTRISNKVESFNLVTLRFHAPAHDPDPLRHGPGQRGLRRPQLRRERARLPGSTPRSPSTCSLRRLLPAHRGRSTTIPTLPTRATGTGPRRARVPADRPVRLRPEPGLLRISTAARTGPRSTTTPIVRSFNTFQLNKYLFLRAIVEYNFYYKRMTVDTLASFTYIPGTVVYVGYGSAFEQVRWNGADYVDSDRFLETKRGSSSRSAISGGGDAFRGTGLKTCPRPSYLSLI